MLDSPAPSAPINVTGVLRWNEFEGGFWSLEADEAPNGLGSVLVLQDFEPPAGAVDGSRIEALVEPHAQLVDFLMAGTRVDVLEVRLSA